MIAVKFGAITVQKLSLGWCVLVMLLVLMAFVVQRPDAIIAGSLLCAVYAFGGGRSLYVEPGAMLFFGGISFFVIPSLLSMNHGESPIFYYISTIVVFFAARRLAWHSPEYLLTAFRSVFAVAVSAIFVVVYVYWDHSEPLGELVPGSSTNGIPSYLIVLQIALSLVTYVARRRLPIISPALTLVVAYFGLGRGSLVVAGLIFLGSVFLNYMLMNAASRFWRFRHLILFATIFLGVGIWDLSGQWLIGETKLREGLVDVYRLEILHQYIDGLDWWGLLVGISYSGTVVDSQYDGNPHISFIRLHAYFGLIGVLLVLMSPLFVVVSRKYWRDRLIFLYFISLAILRATSEPILFPTLLDLFYFFCFFVFWRHVPNRESKVRYELSQEVRK